MNTYSFLSYCARVTCEGQHRRRLANAAQQFTNWETLPEQAEFHNLAPLAYHHLKAAGVEIPPDAKRSLLALILRHRHAAQVRQAVLGEFVSACQAAGIQVIVLKGAALASLLYPEPELRPMRDLDVWVERADLEEAHRLLTRLEGYDPHLEKEGPHVKHLMSGLRRDGLHVSVEIHFRLPGIRREKPVPFPVGTTGIVAHTLSYDEMLRHLCTHMAHHANVFETTRLIWAADAVGFAERFVERIDWAGLRKRSPETLNVLSLLHFLTPLPEAVIEGAGLKIGRAPRDVGADFAGWPRLSLAAQRQKGLPRILRDTLFPSEWWLCLHYELSCQHPLFWYRWVRHPLAIAGWTGRLIHDKIKK
ncbi:MAG: nucleotidyltransferase family protein [Anaerolineae bacterium]|nr:nucleotidyltransferase family protein [Anaerolineae bacterium]